MQTYRTLLMSLAMVTALGCAKYEFINPASVVAAPASTNSLFNNVTTGQSAKPHAGFAITGGGGVSTGTFSGGNNATIQLQGAVGEVSGGAAAHFSNSELQHYPGVGGTAAGP